VGILFEEKKYKMNIQSSGDFFRGEQVRVLSPVHTTLKTILYEITHVNKLLQEQDDNGLPLNSVDKKVALGWDKGQKFRFPIKEP